MRSSREKWGLSLMLAAAALPLAVVSVAFACGRLATLQLGPGRVAPGGQLSGFGRNYTTAPTASPVEIRFNRRDGAVLWSGRPLPNGDIRPAFAVPAKVRAGYYTLLAEQRTGTGAQSPGTPGRSRVFIGTAAQKKKADRAGVAAWAPGSGNTGPSGGPGPWGDVHAGLLAALFSGGLLAGGLALLRSGRRRRPPATLAC